MASVYVWNGEDGHGFFIAKTLQAAVRKWARHYSLDTFMVHCEDGRNMPMRQAAKEIGGSLEEAVTGILFPDSDVTGYWPVKGWITKECVFPDNGIPVV